MGYGFLNRSLSGAFYARKDPSRAEIFEGCEDCSLNVSQGIVSDIPVIDMNKSRNKRGAKIVNAREGW